MVILWIFPNKRNQTAKLIFVFFPAGKIIFYSIQFFETGLLNSAQEKL